MAVNKVVFGNTTIMDITDSTVDSDTLLTGTKAYGANGDPVIGGVVKSWTGTAAQYAEEASQIPDGTQVNILDDFTSVGTPIGIADIYSTDEREIGVWTDGRPLYQKVFISSNAFTIGTSWINTGWNVSFANVLVKTRIVDSVGQVFCGVNAGFISGSLGLQAFSTISNAKICILQYTKTTDAPGSGKYVPSGAPAVHYSTDEQVIGTWIDGKPLYQKTITNQSITLSWVSSNKHALATIDPLIANVDSFIDIKGYIPATNVVMNISAYVDNNKWKLASILGDTITTLTIQYTKTTD